MVSLSLPSDSVPLEQLISVLADEHDIPRTVSIQVMSWFGSIAQGQWKLKLDMLIKEVGLGVLKPHMVPTTATLIIYRLIPSSKNQFIKSTY